MKILGIESSCDETAAALLEVKDGRFEVLNNVVWSQTEIHKKYGGVVPEVAARQHVESINLVIEEVLGKVMKPDLIAVTKGPGLITSLSVGVQAAKTLSYSWQIPLIGVNHLEGHLWSFLLNNKSQAPISPALPGQAKKVSNSKSQDKNKFVNWKLSPFALRASEDKEIGNCLPAVVLIVSGGHTELVLVKEVGRYKLIGQTLDDAVGEAFDKVAKMLNLGYPGGPIVAHFAKSGNAEAIKFPRPMLKSDDFDFSFSGLKTAVKYHLQNMTQTGGLSRAYTNDICASFQQAVIEVLVDKTIRAAQKFKAKSIILGGGVSANEQLIKNLDLKTKESELDFYFPEKWLTGDNAAMIALAGYFNAKKSSPLRPRSEASKNTWKTLTADANLRLV
ncbi:MAG: tRNA (adenosine(37)-N6)-threonylcarbamoyltransferase complex transferase subunit TsaD [Candidatus Komeilibacteria bacterium]|nr:tRNA (adenosine(37)-N6)-threonylcarbamoyltransferase complex transferase subunit TsaD [Candidatus Komeilibacteria bacterium]